MTIREVLKGARELIADPSRWTREELARDEKGDRADPCSPRAVCWCAEGAIRKTLGVGGEDNITPYLRVLAGPIRPKAVFELNDTGTHAEVLETFDEAIAGLEQEGEQPPHPML